MEVRAGYKQTDVGMIPDEWKDMTIGDVCQFSGGSQPPRYTFKFAPADGYIRLIQIRDYKTDEYATYIPKPLVRKVCTDKDIMIGRYGPPIFQILRGLEGAYNVALIKATPNSHVTRAYLWHILRQQELFHLIDGLSRRSSGQTGIEMPALKAYSLPLPPLPEQKAIATALNDMDDLIASLDRLIAKKRDIKQAAMQQLLTGKTRLKGFSGEWEEVVFASLLRHHSGNSTLIKGKLSSDYSSGAFPAFSASGQDVWCDHYEHEGEAIIVSAVGSRCGKTFRANERWCAIANTHVVWPKLSVIDIQFLNYYLNDENFWLKSGSGQPFVLFRQSFARPVRIPHLQEQRAICEVLSDIDAELIELEQRRDKKIALKQGMMQELLTGRTRLI